MPFDHFSIIAPIYARAGVYKDLDSMLLRADLPARGALLDLGGGTGRVARELCSLVDLTVVADISMGMLRFAAQVEGLQALSCTSERLPFPDGCFARIIMVDALHHVENQRLTAREMWRILAAGGRLVIVEPDIRVFGVKLIALAEKLLWMRSHFLGLEQILALFPETDSQVRAQAGSVWIALEKRQNK